MIRPLIILLALSLPAYADEDWKAPVPVKVVQTITFVHDVETDTIVGISPKVLKQSGYRSGQKVKFEEAVKLLKADQKYRKGRLR